MSEKHDIKRGRHRKHASRETRDWNSEYLIPEKPSWMDGEAYSKLVKLRNRMEQPVDRN